MTDYRFQRKQVRGRDYPVGHALVRGLSDQLPVARRNKLGDTVDFLLTTKRDRKAAMRFLRKGINQCGTPDKITIDKSGANAAAVNGYNAEAVASVELRQFKYLNNIVEQDHRAVKRITRPMLGFKSFWSAAKILARIEMTHMIRRGQLIARGGGLAPVQQFYSLAA